MGRLLSPTRSRIRTVLSSIRSVTAGRWWYKVGFSLLGICLIGAARFDSVSEARAAIRHYATHARAALLMTASETTVVFGPKQFVTAKNNPKGNPQINFVESFSVPSATATSATTTEYIIRLEHVGGNLTTATVAVNGTPVAVAADFASATIIERLITVKQTAPNTNSLTLSLKGAEAAGLVVTILGTPNTSVDVFGPKVYEKTAKPKGHEKADGPKGREEPDGPRGHDDEPDTKPAHFVDSFILPAGAVAPYRISATASAPGAKANITLNGVKVIADGDFGPPKPGTTTPVIRDANLVSGNNTLVVDVHGPTGTTITVLVTATDKGAPVLTIASPQQSLVTNAATVSVTGISQDTGPTTVTVNDGAATMSGTHFSATVLLKDGTNTISIVAKDLAGNHTDSTRTVVQDTEAPTLTLTIPADNSFTNQSAVTVSGSVSGGGTITVKVNGVPSQVGQDGKFSGSYQLVAGGANFVMAVATDQAGNNASVTNKVTLDTDAPVVTIDAPAEGLITKETSVAVSGTVSDATATTVTVNDLSAPVGADGRYAATVPLPSKGANAITVVATDAASNQSTVSRSVTRTVETPPGNGSSDALPPDPLVHAPPVQASIATTPFAAGAFLYSGANPLQTGVAEGTIELRRAAVLRGRVLGRDGAPIAGVEITVLDHPELGRTETRASGQYDLAVNGGGNLMLRYVKDGLLPVLRGADADWQDYVVLEDVILLGLDPQVTAVDLTGGTPAMQVARGTAQTDADGTRQATLMFPEGTTATMVLPDGSTQPLSSLHVRATEYTVGENGHRMMPAPLPATSGYTYAVELTVDEARAAGATSVRFNQPVPFYIENFLGFPVGLPVPYGVLDHERGVWVPDENGVIIGIVGKTGGLADVDTNGDGTADDQATLLALGISDDERSRLAAVYETGQTLWRIPLTHFSTVDANWPVRVNGKGPKVKLNLRDPHPRTACEVQARSTIECQTQVLGERIGLVGTPFALHYRSDRAPGRTLANTIEMPLTDGTIPDGLRAVMVTVVVAGREFVDSFPPEPNLKHTFVWDGIDAWGRRDQGGQPVTVTIGYRYEQLYAVPANTARDFGLVCRGYDSTYVQAGADPWLACIIPASVSSTARNVGFVNQVIHTRIGTFSPGAAGLGGWTLDVHDAYDPMARELNTGDGGRRRANSVGAVITTVAGDGSRSSRGDGGPATAASLLEPSGLATGPDGVLYIADAGNNGSVRSVGSDGTIRTVASDVQQQTGPMVVDPSGRVYVISSGQVVYRFTPDGARRELIAGAPDTTNIGGGSKTLIRPVNYLQADRPERDKHRVTMTVASSDIHGPSDVEEPEYWQDAAAPSPDLPTRGASRDSTRSGIVATDLRFVSLSGMSLGPDGVLYLADGGSGYVWRVGVDGIATIFAGVGPFGNAVDAEGILAARATFQSLSGVAAAADGNVYIADGALIRKVGPDGTVTTVAGNIDGRTGADGDMGTNQLLAQIKDVTVGRDGGVYFSTYGRRIYLLRTDGRMLLLAGSGTESNGSDDDGKLATQVGLEYVGGIAVGPDGTVYVSEPGFNQVKAISLPLAGVGRSEYAIAAEDGSSLDVFNSDGLHLRTIDALTGVALLRFGYDFQTPYYLGHGNGNQLTTVTDANDNLTTIVRDELGNPTAVVGPFGQRSDLTLDGDGLLSRVTNPAGEAVALTYRSGGLLATVTDPLGRVSRFTYDSTGLLVRDQDPAGGALDLARTEFDGGWKVSQTTALGQTTTYTTQETPSGVEQGGFRTPGGLQATTVIGTDGSRTVTYPDGHVTTSQTAPDPRFGMQAPTVQSIVVTSPGGIRFEAQEARYATVSDTGSPPALITESGTAVINGRAYTSSFDLATGLQTITTPEGHQARSRIDDKGRLLMAGPEGKDSITFEYDASGQLTTTTQGDRVTRYRYGSEGLLANITDPRGDSIVVTHDSAGRVIRQLLPDGHDVRFSHDAAGNLVSLTNPRGAVYGFANSSVNMLESLTMPSIGGVTASMRYAYDADRRFSKITRPDGRTIAFAYDGTGRATSLSVPEGKVSYTYDPVTGNPATASAPNGTLFSLGYDGGLPVTAAWTGVVAGTIQTSYNNDLRPALMSVDSGNAIDYQYNDDARLIRAGSLAITRGGPGGLPTATSLANVTTSESHSSFGELSAFTAEFSASQLYAATYTRDRLGRVMGVTESIQGESRLLGYEYDHRGRLASVSSNGTAVAVYEYDENGNRLRVTGPGGVLTGVYDARDQVSSYGGTNYIYSPNGEVVRAATETDTTTYAYNTFGSLVSAASSGGKRVDYLLDAANRRIGKSVNGNLVQGFLYEDQLRIVAELDATNNVVSRFVYGTRPYVPDFMMKSGATYRIVSDPAGSVRLVVNAETGAVAQRIDYDEFGRITRNTNPGFQPFGFGGGLYDEDTKLIHFGAREYDAFAGRWTSQDPAAFANGNNLHTYAGNDPVNFGDPSGFDPCDCSQNLLTGIGSDLVAGVNYTLAPGVKPYFAPDFADRLNDAIRTLNGWGVVPRINDGYRTEADQEFQRERGGPLGACNPHGRDACKHQLGYSVDINVRTRVRPGYYEFNPDFGLIVAAMKISDTQWGGEFRTPDWVHFYNNPGGANAKERKARAKQLEDFFNNCLAP